MAKSCKKLQNVYFIDNKVVQLDIFGGVRGFDSI